jgi:hypothetical protein
MAPNQLIVNDFPYFPAAGIAMSFSILRTAAIPLNLASWFEAVEIRRLVPTLRIAARWPCWQGQLLAPRRDMTTPPQ